MILVEMMEKSFWCLSLELKRSYSLWKKCVDLRQVDSTFVKTLEMSHVTMWCKVVTLDGRTCWEITFSPCRNSPFLHPESIPQLRNHTSLGKRQLEEGKSKATPLATTEEVDKEKDEDEEGNDINQVRKQLKVTCGQKVQEFNSAIQQGEVIAGNNPATSDVAVTIDTTITDCATNDATALSQDSQSIIEAQQDDEITSLAAFRIADPTGAAT
ncbi:hypothetical protein D8674_000086 [Pyrus ussuriensis x Pyrus communis]|uniref:Uncharacterized protein n=1 Tax=Pyrus ussuriensis x Pyrus communis TaxID=2448454 RepID=A0A5N5F2C3_9ROSA|nr:hypothetical protein D8674_000086 [Pyrus ussuriensis x Pyrus communis]